MKGKYELFPNYVPRPPLPRKVGGGHDPPAPMGAPPLSLVSRRENQQKLGEHTEAHGRDSTSPVSLPDHAVSGWGLQNRKLFTLKLLYSFRLPLNTDPTCRQRLWSYNRMMPYTFDYYYYYYYYEISASMWRCMGGWVGSCIPWLTLFYKSIVQVFIYDRAEQCAHTSAEEEGAQAAYCSGLPASWSLAGNSSNRLHTHDTTIHNIHPALLSSTPSPHR